MAKKASKKAKPAKAKRSKRDEQHRDAYAFIALGAVVVALAWILRLGEII